MNNEHNYILLLAWSFLLQTLSLLNRRSQRQQTSADRQSTEVYFEYCLSRWMHIIRRITAVKTYHLKRCSVSLCDLCGLNFVSFMNGVYPERSRMGGETPQKQNKAKTNPIQSQTNPIFPRFWRQNFIISPKIDDTKLNFLCKTKPIYKNEQWSMRYHFKQKMQNEPNLNIFLIS